ncbi:MAG: UTP--glucose-1-phosphate uridylyltransferase GalU [Legionellales bacterium]|nr:UTP--glucose-1-phosphate uridylyltransferase GalU [Legionellales bacterium]
MASNPINKAVFPVAGLGTRFLPATKANPKEMLPIVDKPLIQYAVEEALACGITELIFVTSQSKRAIENHFDRNFELERVLDERKKSEALHALQQIIPDNVSCVYIRQPQPRGLGHAVWCARNVVGQEPFALILADVLLGSDQQVELRRMCQLFDQTHGSVIAVNEVPTDAVEQYGIVSAQTVDNGPVRIDAIVEKPSPATAPSNLAVAGRYILTPAIFDCLTHTQADKAGEIQLTDAIASLLADEAVYAHALTENLYDCGSKLGYLRATVDYGLRHPDLGEDLRQFLQTRVQEF